MGVGEPSGVRRLGHKLIRVRGSALPTRVPGPHFAFAPISPPPIRLGTECGSLVCTDPRPVRVHRALRACAWRTRVFLEVLLPECYHAGGLLPDGL